MGKDNVKLFDRDKELLELLGRFGVIYISDVRNLIYNSGRYYRTRLSQLEDGKYIIRHGKRIVYLGVNGVRYLESIGIRPRAINANEKYRRKLAEMYHLSSELVGFTLETSREVRAKNMDSLGSKRYRFYGKAKGANNQDYWIYRINKISGKVTDSKIKGKKLDISSIKNDIKERISDFGPRINVIVFADDELTMNLYKEDLTQLGINKEIVLLYDDENIEYANEIIAPELSSEENLGILLRRSEYKVCDKKNNSLVDFILDKNGKQYYTFNLTGMEFKKEKNLKGYIDILGDKNLLSIICYHI